MNGIHDMGGMHGMGSIDAEVNEPVFHERWESRVFVLNRAIGPFRKWNIDTGRFGIEQIPPADYLRMSYYERWFHRFVTLLVKTGLISAEELRTGKPDPGSVRLSPPVTVHNVPQIALNRNIGSSIEPSIKPRFKAGQKVRALNLHPTGHTRLPRYARGKVGTIDRDHGVYDFPDTNAENRGTKRQHVYAVRFAARELWGDQASPRDSVYLDLWDDYLERA